jgi:hypothetical protein
MNRTLLLSRMAVLACLLPVAAAAQQAPAPLKPLAHTYHVTYTLTVTEAGKRVGIQHFTMTVSAPTNHGTVKMGEKVPVITGSYGPNPQAGVQTQFTYLDVGINIDAMLAEDANGLELTSKVEQSSVAPAPVKLDEVNEPVIRQMVLSNTSLLVPGKPVTLGSLDLPDTTRHIDIEVTAEQAP